MVIMPTIASLINLRLLEKDSQQMLQRIADVPCFGQHSA
jgi:hypothetical protein